MTMTDTTKSLATVTRHFNDVAIGQRAADGYLNATAMCKANGREWSGYMRNAGTEEFIGELARSLQIRRDLLAVSVTTGPNKDRGTWVHPQVAYHLAQWCSPAFAVQVTEWIHDIKTQGYAAAPGVEITAPTLDLRDPDTLLGLLAGYAADKKALTAKVVEMAPAVEALDRLATPTEGARNITETAKLLQVQPKQLFDFMQKKGWIYRRPGMDRWIAYQARIQAGELEHKLTNIERSDGTTQTKETVMVTPAGRVKLGRLIFEEAAAK